MEPLSLPTIIAAGFLLLSLGVMYLFRKNK
jgi:LPXTG-motif cell wall-anchored protein